MSADSPVSSAGLSSPGAARTVRGHGLPPLGFFVKALAIELIVVVLPAWLIVQHFGTVRTIETDVYVALFANAFLLLCSLWAWFLWTQRERGLGTTRRERRFSALLAVCCAGAWAPVLWMLTERNLNASWQERISIACIVLVSLPCALRIARAARNDLVAWREHRAVSFQEGCRRWALIAAVFAVLVALPKTYYRACERMRVKLETNLQPAGSEAKAQAIKNLLHDAVQLGGPNLLEAYRGFCEVGDTTSVPLLIEALRGVAPERLDREPWHDCLSALRIITNQAAPRTHEEWLAWYARNSTRPHLAWIADGFAARGIRAPREGDAASIRTLLRIVGNTMHAAVSGGQLRVGGWLDWSRRRPRLLLVGGKDEKPGEAYNAYLLCKSYNLPSAKDMIAELARSDAPVERMGAAVFAACERSVEFDEILASLRKDPDCAVRWYAAANVLSLERLLWDDPREASVTSDSLPWSVLSRSTEIDNGIMYVSPCEQSDNVAAYDPMALERLWAFPTPLSFGQVIAVDAHRVFMSSVGGRILLCLGKKDGHEIWRSNLGAGFGPSNRIRVFPCGEHVIVEEMKNRLFCVCSALDGAAVNVGQGSILAARDSVAVVIDAQGVCGVAIPTLTASPPFAIDGQVDSALLYGDLTAMVVARPGGLWLEGWSLQTRIRTYATQLSFLWPDIEATVLDARTLYISAGGATWAVRLADGAIVWQSSVGGRVFLAEKNVLVGTDVRMHALDYGDGRLTALWALPDELWGCSSDEWVAHLAGDRVLFFHDDRREVVNLAGN